MLFGHLASYFDWYLSDNYLWQFFGINVIPKDCFIGFKMGQYCYFQTKISWNKVYLKLRNWFVFLLCSLHLTSVWCIFWMSYPMMSMDWLIENSTHDSSENSQIPILWSKFDAPFLWTLSKKLSNSKIYFPLQLLDIFIRFKINAILVHEPLNTLTTFWIIKK